VLKLSDQDSGLQPKLSVQSGEVEGALRHLAHEDLEAYTSGRLAPARLSYCQAHLDSCEACRAELEDLRTFKSELSGFQRPEPADRRELARGKRRRGVTLSQAASVATVLAAAVATALWWGHTKPRANKATPAVSVAQSLTAPPASNMPTRDARLANSPAARADVATPAIIQHDELTDVNRSRGHASPSVGSGANTGFALLGPLGEAIAETRPQFSWQPLPGAVRYSVAIVDARLHPVQRSPALRTTVWRPRRPLRRGRTYLWQVTATLRGGSKVVASGPGVTRIG